MLKRIEIENYRSCRHVILDDLGPLTVLVGRNAVGKTNILGAIEWLVRCATDLPTVHVPRSGGAVLPRGVTCQAVLGEKTFRYSLRWRASVVGEGEPPTKVAFSESLRYMARDGAEYRLFERNGESVTISEGNDETTIHIGEFAPCMPALVSLLPAGSPTIDLVAPFLGYLRGIRYYPLGSESRSQEGSAIRQVDYDTWAAGHRDGWDGSVLMRLLHMWLTRREQFVVCHDADGPDPEPKRQLVMQRIVKPSGLTDACCIVVPVQELEAWILADIECAVNMFPSWRPSPVNNPERISEPKELVVKLSRESRSRPRYIPTVHNQRMALHLDLDKVARKCQAFRELTSFVAPTGTGEAL